MPTGRGRADVTVVVPTRNRATYLARCLTVVRAQVGVDIEIVVVDDGSTIPVERTRALETHLDDDRIRVVRHERSRGVGAARNAGIRVARSPWVAFIDDDDFWAPHKLMSQVGAVEDTPSSRWSYTGAVLLREDLTVLRVASVPSATQLPDLLARYNAVPGGGSSVLVDVRVLRELGGFDESFSILADWELWLRLVRRSNPVAVGAPLVGYVRHPGGLSVDTERSIEEFSRLRRTQVGGAARSEFDFAMFHMYLAELEFTMGRRREGLHNLVRATLGEPGRSLRLSAVRLAHHRAERAARGGAAGFEDSLRQWREADLASRRSAVSEGDHAWTR